MHISTARYTLSKSVVREATLDLDLQEGGSRFPVTRAYGTVHKTKVHLIRTNGEGSSVRYFTWHTGFNEEMMTATDKCKSAKLHTHTCRFQPSQGSHFKCTTLHKFFALKLTVTQPVKKKKVFVEPECSSTHSQTPSYGSYPIPVEFIRDVKFPWYWRFGFWFSALQDIEIKRCFI